MFPAFLRECLWHDVVRGALIWKWEDNSIVLTKSRIFSSYQPLCNSPGPRSLLGVIIISRGKKYIIWTFNLGARNRFQFMFFQNDYLLHKEKSPHWKSSRDNETFRTSIPIIYLPLGRSLLARLSPRELGIQTLKWVWGLGTHAGFRPALISTPVFILQVLMGREGKWLPYAFPHLFQMQRETHFIIQLQVNKYNWKLIPQIWLWT